MSEAILQGHDVPFDSVQFFAELETRLANLSHTDEAIRVIESLVNSRLKKTSQKQVAFANPGAICIDPITYEKAVAAAAISSNEDHFSVLQGDIISTDSAYFMGERIVGGALFAVLNSTCDLVPGRREYASLLRVSPIAGTPDAVKSVLHQLLRFKSRRDLYLPSLPNEQPSTLGYSIRFDGVAQIRIEDLLLANRLCSLSLAGWRIFGSFARVLISRAGEGEASLRKQLAQ